MKRLLEEQQRIQQELAELQQQAGDLSTEELADLKALLAARESPASAADTESNVQQQQQKKNRNNAGKKKGEPSLPPDIVRFFRGAGVLDAMDSRAAPREPQDERRQSNSDKLKVICLSLSLPAIHKVSNGQYLKRPYLHCSAPCCA